jgi:hypothetical protein
VHSTRSASDKTCQLIVDGQWFSPGTLASSTTKAGHHDIAEKLLNVALTPKINQLTNIQVGYTSVHRFLIAVTVTRAERGVVVFNATLNNISVISWRSVLSVEETGVPGENHRPFASNRQTSSHNIVSNTPRLSGVRTHNISGDKGILHNYFFYCSNCNPMFILSWFFFLYICI